MASGATTMSSTLGVTIEEKKIQKFIKDHEAKIKSEDEIWECATSEHHFDTLRIYQEAIKGCLKKGCSTGEIPTNYCYGEYKCPVCN